MSTVTLSWSEPVKREDGRALALAEIAFTDVLLSSDKGLTFVKLGAIAPGAANTLQKDIGVGTYIARFVAQDKSALRSKNLDKPFTVSAPPSPPDVVTDVTITVS